MITKTKKVYYCEYCGKHRLLPLLKHEKHCTSNPDRECRLCGRTESVKPLIDKYKKQCLISEETNEFNYSEFVVIKKPNIDVISGDTDGCPNCILTILKGLDTKTPILFDFNYQEELKKWWDKHNQEINDNYEYC